MASYTLSDGYKIKGLDGSDTATTLANNVGSSLKNIGSKAVKKLTAKSQTAQPGANDGNAFTHDVSAGNGGTTEANCRTADQVMEEMKALHKQKMDKAFSKVKSTVSSFTAGVSSKIKSLGDTLKSKQEESVSTIDSSDKDFGLVKSSDQVLDKKVEEDTTVHASEKRTDGNAVTDGIKSVRDNLLKSLIPEGSELAGFVNLAESNVMSNGRELPNIISPEKDSGGLGK